MISRPLGRFAGGTILGIVMVLSGSGWACGQGIAGKRDPVPSSEAQNKVLDLIREVFKKEHEEAKTAPQKVALAAELLKRGTQSQDTIERFVLMRVARDMAALAGEAELACDAVNQIAQLYQVDGAAMKKETLAKVSERASVPKQYKAVAEQAALAMDDAIAADDYSTAGELAQTALAAARKAHDAAITARVEARAKEIEEIAKSRAEVKQAMATLEKNPGDPKANLTVGRYYCLLRGDWEKGLPMLALAGDEAFSPLARKELTGATTADEKVALADAWWELVAKSDASYQRQLRERAAFWYDKALPDLSGLTKMRVEKRLGEMVAAEPDSEPEDPPEQPGTAPKTVRTKKKPSFEGTWRDSFNSVIQFTVEDRKVIGTYKNVYTFRDGDSYIRYEGRIVGTLSRDRRTLTAQWARSPSYNPPDEAGALVFTLSKDGSAFMGTFTCVAAPRPSAWSGVRVK